MCRVPWKSKSQKEIEWILLFVLFASTSAQYAQRMSSNNPPTAVERADIMPPLPQSAERIPGRRIASWNKSNTIGLIEHGRRKS
mmetsp:Transcript_19168/g.45176  ORF Transcript_19168/g.45176 Transcript_19168/m.45176 type:complete len:84 (-) Transcript_19168:281-532(-)